MKRFLVYIDKNVVGAEAIEEIIEMPDNATEEECDDACADCLQMMISNELDTGWFELEEENNNE